MSILKRLQRIARAGIGRLLDKAEPPEQELESQIAEVAKAFEEGRECAAAYGANVRRMQRQQEQLCQQQEQWQRQAAEAMRGGDEAAARSAIARRLEAARRAEAITPALAEASATYDKLRLSVRTLQDQLEQAKLRLAELRARRQSADAQLRFQRQVEASPVGQGPAGERLLEEVEQVEAEVEVRREISEGSSPAGAIDRRTDELRIEAEMEALRRQLRSQHEQGAGQ